MNISDYKYKIELHAHTKPCSSCSSTSPENMVKYCKEAGCDAVAITNHLQPHWHISNFNSKKELMDKFLWDYRETKRIGDMEGLTVILGVEVHLAENNNDYLIYGIDEDFIGTAAEYLHADLKTLYTELKDDKNVFIHAHPFRNNMTRMPDEYLDGIETFNMHPGHFGNVSRVCQYAKEHDFKITTCGSDFHDVPNHGLALLRTKTLPKDSFELAELLKSRDYLFDISGNIIIPYGFNGEL